MFTIKAQELIKELLESFASVGNIPIAIYEKDDEGMPRLIAQSNKSHFPEHCQHLWKIKDGEDRCKQDMLERANEGFTSDKPQFMLCHAGLTTEIHSIVIEGQTVAILQFGAFLEPGREDEGERIDRHANLMKSLRANPQMAVHIKELLLDDSLRRSANDRDWLRRTLPRIIERVIYQHLIDLGQELRVRKQEKSVKDSAYHDVQLRLQAALAHADNHLTELKDPNSKNWYLRESAEKVARSIELAGTVLQNLMRGEYLPDDYRFEQKDLRDIVMDAISLAHPMAQQKNVLISHEIKPPHMRIQMQVSIVHLQQAFNNLVHNAVKYSYRASQYGGREVKIRGFYAEQGYKVVICNYGVGILEDEFEKIFEPRYTGVLRQKEYRTGSGLGLPLAKEVIEKHHGKISLSSLPMGDPANDKNCPYLTEFTVWLPLTQPGKSVPAGKAEVKR